MPIKEGAKGMVFSKKELIWTPAPFMLCDNPLPWVKSAKYLGNIITNMVSGLNKDVRSKRAMFIEKKGKILQEFSFAHPQVKCNINTIHNSSFTGCVLWDFSSENVHQLVNSWSVATMHIYGTSQVRATGTSSEARGCPCPDYAPCKICEIHPRD